MALYTEPTISGYKGTEPSNDGSETNSNKVDWDTIVDNLSDPVKNQQDAINTNLTAAFAKLLGSGISSKTSAYTVTVADAGKIFRVTGATTLTLPPVGTAGSQFVFMVQNEGSSNVTLDPNGSEQISGASTFTVSPNEGGFVATNGSAWVFVGYTAASAALLNATLTTATLVDPTFNDTTNCTTIDSIIDDDTMADDDPNALSTQQSIKAYVDTSISTHATTTYGHSGVTALGSSSSEDLTNIPSSAAHIELILYGVSLSGSDELELQLGNSSGFISSGYTGAVSRPGPGSTNWPTDAAQLTRAQSDGEEITMIIHMTKMTSTYVDVWLIEGFRCHDGTNAIATESISGFVDVTDTLTQIRLQASGTDTFDNGDIMFRYRS